MLRQPWKARRGWKYWRVPICHWRTLTTILIDKAAEETGSSQTESFLNDSRLLTPTHWLGSVRRCLWSNLNDLARRQRLSLPVLSSMERMLLLVAPLKIHELEEERRFGSCRYHALRRHLFIPDQRQLPRLLSDACYTVRPTLSTRLVQIYWRIKVWARPANATSFKASYSGGTLRWQGMSLATGSSRTKTQLSATTSIQSSGHHLDTASTSWSGARKTT